MIIECPACTTRYEIKAELPRDGRTVRCAKCETVWRAMPDSGGEEGEASASSWVAPSAASEETHDADAEQTNHDHFGTTEGGEFEEGIWSSHQDAAAIHQETVAEGKTTHKEAGGEPQLEWRTGESVSPEEDDSGKVSWFSSFRRRKPQKPTDEAEETAVRTPQATAETIQFPRNNFAVAQHETETKDEQFTIDAARQAVQGVFSSLGHRGSATDAMSDDDDGRAVTGPATPLPQNGWAEKFAGLSDHFKKADETGGDQSLPEADSKRGVSDEGGRDLDTGEDDAWFAEKKDNAGDDHDADTALREAMRAHFLSPSKRAHVGPSLRDEELAQKLETHLKSTAVTTSDEHPRPQGLGGLWGRVSPAAHEEVFEPVVEEPVDVKDDDTAFDQRLYREIEETREMGAAPRRRRRGGLAVAAAWGLFLCVASGLIVGFFAFRDIISDAAPGLAPLYRILGMPVTAQPLAFESVEYEWSTSDNRPVLTVRGNVFNQANRNVRVPQFFITIKDQDSAQDREYSANLRINGSKIRSNERADFDIELVSPNPTVTAVELELRNVR